MSDQPSTLNPQPSTRAVLLLVEDDEDIRSQMKWALTEDYEIHLAHDGASAVELFQEQTPVVTLLDLGLPPRPNDPDEGLATLSKLLAIRPTAKILIVSGQGERKNALQAIGKGAYDFITKPADVEELKVILRRAVHVAGLESEVQRLQESIQHDTFEGMVGTSPQMQQVFTTIRRVATSDAPVLILGESGTGKEMAALAVHRLSPRKDQPFVAINCGAIPENLIESELFGHEKGSFTGAHTQRKGRIEMAEGGTLFLDEIGELPMLLQVKLLRFLQEQTIERVGGRSTIQIDTRVVAATNIDLKTAMGIAKFREDLYYRLAVVVLKLPALRERPSDIPVLARAFLKKFAAQNKREVRNFSPPALMALEKHDWPGNVRELENRVRRAVIMADGRFANPEDLELGSGETPGVPRTLKEAREEVEREMVLQALRRHNDSITKASADLGISRPTFYELMEKLGLHKTVKE
ncbi:MAG: zraR 26 [Verrucomicrobiales bacterium]|nr:zraR 26 [Verrucomicrobiales bacterium]